MSLINVNQLDLIRQAKLLQYANTKRNDGDFNDVTIQAGAESISANRMVLACYSKFFELMFRVHLRERYQSTVEIKEFDGQAVKSVIEYIYTGKIDINANNVMILLGVSDFLQVDDIKQTCFDYLESALTVDNCLDVLKAFVLYNHFSPLRKTYQFISEHFDKIVQKDNFITISKLDFTSLITNIDRNIVQETSLYTTIINWVKHDKTREVEFSSLFLKLNLQKISSNFVLNTIANEQLVRDNNACLNAAFSYFTSTSKQTQEHENVSKILCLGGNLTSAVLEVWNSFGTSRNDYCHLPQTISGHHALKIGDFVYCVSEVVGGCHGILANRVYRLNLKTVNSQWEEVASLKHGRRDFGAAIWNGMLVVTGGYYVSTRFKSTELYEPLLNKWKTIAPMIEGRYGHELAVANDKLFAIGGLNDKIETLSSVEQLDDVNGRWTFIKPMSVERHLFAAVTCDNFIYAIGGLSTEKTHKTVEKYDLDKNEWSFVQNINLGREGHAACVLNGIVFVVGGLSEEHVLVKLIECFDPISEKWSIVGKIEQELYKHAAVAV